MKELISGFIMIQMDKTIDCEELGALCKAVTLPLGHLSSPNICTNNGT